MHAQNIASNSKQYFYVFYIHKLFQNESLTPWNLNEEWLLGSNFKQNKHWNSEHCSFTTVVIVLDLCHIKV